MCSLLAYLDAGSGSILLQALMGGFAGVVVLSKIVWQHVRPRLGMAQRKVGSES